MTDWDLDDFAKRYMATWNEPDSERRREAVVELWAPDGAVVNARREYRGLNAVHEAVSRSYEGFISRGYLYRPLRRAMTHHHAVRFDWEMVTSAGDEPVSIGVNFLLLDDERRISLDYQFVDG
jgi:hypothetical protein